MASEYHDLTEFQKMHFMQTAIDKFGEDINKVIRDEYECSTSNTDTYHAKTNIKYMEFGDAEKKYKDRPDVWEHILDNADQFTCDVTGIAYIGIPNYSAEHDHSHKKDETRKRTIQSEKVVKAVKKPRKTPGGKGQGKGGNGENVEKMIALSERQKKDRDTTEQKLIEACVEFEATIMHANAPEIKSEIPPKFLANATGMANGFKELIQAVGAFKEEQVASKRFSEWLKNAREAVRTCIATNEKMTSYVEDAQNQWDEEEE